jgi:hypothetical protein
MPWQDRSVTGYGTRFWADQLLSDYADAIDRTTDMVDGGKFTGDIEAATAASGISATIAQRQVRSASDAGKWANAPLTAA